MTYDINFTLQNGGQYTGIGGVTFGTAQTSLDYALSDSDSYFTGTGYVFLPVDYDFTAIATSATTTISFDFVLDESESAALSNLEITQVTQVTQVPEISATRLFCYAGCALLLAKRIRKVIPRQKLAVKLKA
jgi:hypothetical protein